MVESVAKRPVLDRTLGCADASGLVVNVFTVCRNSFSERALNCRFVCMLSPLGLRTVYYVRIVEIVG